MKIPKVFTRINRKGLYPAESPKQYGGRAPGEKPFDAREQKNHHVPKPMTAEQLSFQDHLAHAVVHNYWNVLTDEERWEAECERALQNGEKPPRKLKKAKKSDERPDTSE